MMLKNKEGLSAPVILLNVVAGVFVFVAYCIIKKKQKEADEKIATSLCYAFSEEEFEDMYKPLYEHYKEDSEYYCE